MKGAGGRYSPSLKNSSFFGSRYFFHGNEDSWMEALFAEFKDSAAGDTALGFGFVSGFFQVSLARTNVQGTTLTPVNTACLKSY
jgi:hypothetical protein